MPPPPIKATGRRATGQGSALFQRVLLRAYATVAATGILDHGPTRRLYEWAYGAYKTLVESRGIRALRPLLVPGTVVIDVGANIGYYTQRFARWVGDAGRVLALEPDPANYSRLCHALARKGLLSRVEALALAVSDRPGEGRLEQNPAHPGDHRLGDRGLVVKVTTLDELMGERGWPRVSLVKIDVQGTEARVIAGANELLDRFAPVLFVEVDDAGLRRFGSSGAELLETLKGAHYGLHVIRGGTISRPLAPDEVLGSVPARGYLNILAIPQRS